MEYTVKLHGAREKAMFDLRALYEAHGYRQYRMSKFEEYDLYAQNRSFISGGSILTFTDTNGRLMALKPDITLSIIKGAKLQGNMDKVYYSESVYRAPDKLSGFREIQQMGLECIGGIDLYTVCEVLCLAAESLKVISGEYILDMSHMGLLSGVFDDAGIPEELRPKLLALAEAKNAHEAEGICRKAGVSQEHISTLLSLIKLRAPMDEALARLHSLPLGPRALQAVSELHEIASVLDGAGLKENIYVDLSLQSDPGYYNGLVFKGYLGGIPSAILSGGRYDGLMEKMGKDAGAMGFALYLNLLDGFGGEGSRNRVDVLILDSGHGDAAGLMKLVKSIIEGGESVRVDTHIPEGLKYGRIVIADEREGV